MKPATQLIHVAEGISRDASPLTTPIYETTTFLFENAQEVLDYNEGRSTKFLYSRYENPTVLAVEQRIAALEGAAGALVFSSGQAATTTALLGLLAAGDEVVCSGAIYGGTLHLIADLLPKFGITPRFVSIDELRQPDSIFSPSTKLVWFESPINPTLRCVDIAAVAAACRAHGVLSVVDNTFASPINQQPLALGVDVVMHSATKYSNGHSDVTAGVLAGSSELMRRCSRRESSSGPCSIRTRRTRSAGGSRRWRSRGAGRTRARWPSPASSSSVDAWSGSTTRASRRTPITPSRSAR